MIRASAARASAAPNFPRSTDSRRRCAARATEARAASPSTSASSTSNPRAAATARIPAPIVPPPTSSARLIGSPIRAKAVHAADADGCGGYAPSARRPCGYPRSGAMPVARDALGLDTVAAVVRSRPEKLQPFLFLMWLVLREDPVLHEGMLKIKAALPDPVAARDAFEAIKVMREMVPALSPVMTDEQSPRRRTREASTRRNRRGLIRQQGHGGPLPRAAPRVCGIPEA